MPVFFHLKSDRFTERFYPLMDQTLELRGLFDNPGDSTAEEIHVAPPSRCSMPTMAAIRSMASTPFCGQHAVPAHCRPDIARLPVS
jgi:hypothetical protein